MPFPKDKTVVVTHGLADYLAAGSPSSRSTTAGLRRAGGRRQAAGPVADATTPPEPFSLSAQRPPSGGSTRRGSGCSAGPPAPARASGWRCTTRCRAGSPDPVARESTRPSCVAVAGAQTSLDPEQMRAWIPNSVYGGHAFGFDGPWTADVFQRFYEGRDRVLPWIKEYSPSNGQAPAIRRSFSVRRSARRRRQVEKDPTHSAVFGTKLQQRLREVGVECHFRILVARDEVPLPIRVPGRSIEQVKQEGAMSSRLCTTGLLLAAISSWAMCVCGNCLAAESPQPEFISDALRERISSASLSWGSLGLNTAVKPSHRDPNRLRIGETVYDRGLGVHADSEVAVDLAGEYLVFEAEVACSGRGGRRGLRRLPSLCRRPQAVRQRRDAGKRPASECSRFSQGCRRAAIGGR